MKGRRWSVPAGLVIGSLILAACGGPGQEPTAAPGDEGTPAPAESGAAPTEEASADDRLPIIMAVDGQILQLSNAASDVPTAEAAQFLYNGLYQYDAGLNPIPDLAAEECAISEGEVVWTCTLREATFHNGDPVTADDVAFTYELAKSPNCRFNPAICLEQFLASVTAVDATTVEFTLLEPYAPFATVVLPGIGIESRAVIEAAFQEFTGAAEAAGVTAEGAQALADELTALVEAEEPDAAACEQALPEAEELLTAAEVQVPERESFEGEEGFDACGMAEDLANLLGQVAGGLESEGVDGVAAVYPLLSFNQEPVGTGPWMCEPGCLQAGESLILTAYENHYAGPPEAPEIQMPIITDDVAGASALAAGEIDWKYSLTSDGLTAVEGNPNVKLVEYPDFGYFFLAYNLREGRLFADVNLRRAVQLCIDKAAIVEVATNGQGVPVEADIPPASWAYNPNIEPVQRDVAAATALIEESGWTRGADGVYANAAGERLSTQVYVRAGRPDRIAFMQLLRDQVAECGIQFEVVEADFATVLTPLLNYPHIPPNSAEPFDAYFGGWSTSLDPDPFSIWHSSQCTSEAQPETFNYICYNNPRVDEIIEEGLATTDQAARAELYFEFQEILAEEQPYLFAWSDLAREGLDVNLQSTAGELDMSSPLWFWQIETLHIDAAQ